MASGVTCNPAAIATIPKCLISPHTRPDTRSLVTVTSVHWLPSYSIRRAGAPVNCAGSYGRQARTGSL